MPAARVPRDVTRFLPLLLVLAACGDPAHYRRYPRWVIEPTVTEVQWRECAGVRAFVRRSGKQGIGVALELRSRTDCKVTLAASAVLADGTVGALPAPMVQDLRGRSLLYLWLPLHFDGDAAWNRGARTGSLELALTVEGRALPAVSFPLVEQWAGPWGPE